MNVKSMLLSAVLWLAGTTNVSMWAALTIPMDMPGGAITRDTNGRQEDFGIQKSK